MPVVADCEVLKNDEVAPGHFRLAVHGPSIADHARAGQFCMLRVTEGLHPFLRRPMSIERIYPDGLSFLYKVEGEGTAILSRFLPGQSISVQGPLGNGFPIDVSYRRHILVGGGIGVAPLPALAETIVRETSSTPEVITAARNHNLILCQDDFRQMGCKVHVATDDGSLGQQALAHDVLAQLSPGPDTCVYVCGPMIMMAAVSKVAMTAAAHCLVSLEAQMACGDGACLGCVVEAKQENEGERMVRVCVDGPVFDTSIID